MALTLRTIKGSRLTHEELDGNFRHFTGSHTVDGTVTATAFVGDGSGLTNITATPDLTGTGVVSGSVQLDGTVLGNTANIVASGSFSGSFVGDGSGLTGLSTFGGSAYVGTADVDYYTDTTMLKRDNLVIRNANVTIGVPPASNFPLGTVVEFDIYIPTGSTWTLACLDTAGTYQPGFMVQGQQGFDQMDFNPQFDLNGNIVTMGWTGFFNSLSSQFASLNGDAYHPGPALVRMVAMFNAWNSVSPPTTPASGLNGYLWAVRIISREPMTNSPGTNLAVEVVSALPLVGMAKGNLVIYDDGLSGPKLHFFNGSSWDQL